MYDYIVVGLGVAGWSFLQQLEENRQNYVVFDNQSQQSTRIAGGMFNPVILKRFTPAWQAHDLQYGQKFIHYIDIYRKLTSIEEQNNWTAASDKPVLSEYMKNIVFEQLDGIEVPFGFGVLQGTGIVNVAQLLDVVATGLKQRRKLIEDNFDYKQLQIFPEYVSYQDIKARKIVFAEGYGIKRNPFFSYLPLIGTKGEMLMIETDADIPYIVKSNVFIAPNVSRKGQYYVGATYNWEDKTNMPTKAAREHLESKLQKLLHKPYKVIQQKAGIRPTVIDRRPLAGKHPEFSNLAVLNGMGTRGVILAPTVAKQLFQYLEFNMPIIKEVDIKRFSKF